MKKITLLFVLLTGLILKAQPETELFPDDLLIKPFTANYLEPKLGFLFNLVKENDDQVRKTLRLEVGNSIDIYRVNVNKNEAISFGADLFTYSRLRSEKEFKFPVEAIDYLFGLNFGYLKCESEMSYGFRFRLSHISAHLVDGRFSAFNSDWLDNRLPFVYSKEFFEFMPFIEWNNLRGYLGLTYNYNIKPKFLGKDNYQIGFDYFYDGFGNCNLYPFFGYDLRISNLTDYYGNNTVSLGVKSGQIDGKGFSVYFSYYAGHSIHGELWDQKVNYSAIGFNLDL